MRLTRKVPRVSRLYLPLVLLLKPRTPLCVCVLFVYFVTVFIIFFVLVVCLFFRFGRFSQHPFSLL